MGGQSGERRYRGKVLVLGSDNRSFLTVVRSLGRQGIDVHVGWCPPHASALRSRYVRKAHDLPPYSPYDDGWKRAFVSTLEQERFDLVIPCTDGTLIPLKVNQPELEQFARIAVPNDEAFAVVFDKFKSTEMARSLGVRTPREVVVSDITDTDDVVSGLRLPVMLKPRSSYWAESSRRQVRRAYSPEAFIQGLQTLLAEWGEVQVQENFIGTGMGVELLAQDGDLLLVFQHQRVHERLLGGSTYRKSVAVQPDLLDATASMMKALAYTGVAMVEYKVNLATGDWIFVEINGRFWGSLPLAVAAGADFPYYLYQMLVKGRREFPQGYRTGLYCRNLINDIGWQIYNLRSDRSDPTLNTLPLLQVAKEFTNLLTLRERSDTFVADDPMPGFHELASRLGVLAGQAARRLLGALRLVPLRLPLFRRAYSNRARRALREAESVLFVCKGNIMRSAFAQHYARSRLPATVKLRSTGFYPESGRTCPEEALEVARAMGVDLTSHRSSIVTEKDVGEAQVIFVFDRDNYDSIVAEFPFARHKTYFLGSLARKGPVVIRDPYGRGARHVRAAFASIATALDSYASA